MSSEPPPSNPYAATDQPPVANSPGGVQGDTTGGLIPYKNPSALIAYYLAVFSLIPCIGLLLGIPAVVLGVIGLRKQRANPLLRGTAHAWIGIILGGCTSLLWLSAILFTLATMYFQAR